MVAYIYRYNGKRKLMRYAKMKINPELYTHILSAPRMAQMLQLHVMTLDFSMSGKSNS